MILHRTEEPSSTSKYCDLFSLSQLVGENLQGATNSFLRSCNEMEKILFTKIPRIEKGILKTWDRQLEWKDRSPHFKGSVNKMVEAMQCNSLYDNLQKFSEVISPIRWLVQLDHFSGMQIGKIWNIWRDLAMEKAPGRDYEDVEVKYYWRPSRAFDHSRI